MNLINNKTINVLLFFPIIYDRIIQIKDEYMIDINEVNYLLNLAKLEISEDEKQGLKNDLENILKYVEKLSEVNTDNVLPMTGGTFNINEYRKDNFENINFNRDKVLESAPKRDNDLFEVPKIFE